MSEYAAEVSTGIVAQIIVGSYVWANQNLDGEWVDCSNGGDLVVGIGYTWDGNTFSEPVIPVPSQG
jgi:hypothetical protein